MYSLIAVLKENGRSLVVVLEGKGTGLAIVFGGNGRVSSTSLQKYDQFRFPNRRKQLKTKLVVVVEGNG